MTSKLFAFIDTETTGLDFTRHELIEIGLVLARAEDNGAFTVVEEWDVKIKPLHIENADPISLKVNKYDPSTFGDAIPLAEAMAMLSKKTDGAIMVGHNVAHDFAFLATAFSQTSIENKMHYHKLDTVSIAYAKLRDQNDIDRYSLYALCQYFGIENANAHSALSDARTTFELYKKLMAV